MSNPKAMKAKAIYERIQKSDRVAQLAVINQEIEDDPDFNALDKMNLGSMVNMKMKSFTEGVLDKVNQVLIEVEPEKGIEALYPDQDQNDKRSPYRIRVGQLYTMLFVASSGHPSKVIRNFERYMDDVSSVFKNLPDKYNEILDDWDEHRWNGRDLKLDDDLYWHADHMTILRGDIKRVQSQSEEAIQNYYKTGDVDWAFLDLLRRTIHAIELIIDNYDDLKTYIDDAKERGLSETLRSPGETQT